MRFLQLIVLGICIGCLSPSNAFSQDIQVGDQVEFTKSGRTLTGEVIELVSGGKYARVKYTAGGNESLSVIPLTKATKVGGSTKPNSGNEFRKWKDQTGKFEISAQLVSKSKTHVTLKKSDGTTIEVPIEKLSDEDKKFLSDGEKNAPEVIGLIETDTSSLKTVEVNGSELWNVQPDPVPSVAEGVSEFPVPYTENRYRRFLFTPDRKMMFIGADRNAGFDLCLIDLASGKVSWTGRSSDPLARQRCPLAVSPDPQLVVYAGPGSLFFAHLKKSGLIKGIVQWTPFEEAAQNGIQTGFPLVAFVGTDHVLTVSTNVGTAVLWEWKSAKAVWRADFTPGIAPALSHNSKYLVIHSKNQLCFLDAKSGEVIGRIKCSDRGQDQMAFSPDGKLLAVTGSRLGRVYDLTTAKKIGELSAHHGIGEHGLYKHPVWLNNQTLHYKANFDVKTGMRYTESSHPFDGESLLGGTEYIRIMSAGTKTQKAIRRDLDELVKSAPEKQNRGYVLAPSDSVSLDFQSQGLSEAEHEVLRQSMVNQLTSNGIKIVDDSSKKIAIRLTCKMHSANKTMEGGKFLIQGGRVVSANQIMRFDNREFILNSSGLYVGKAFYDIATMDKTIKTQLYLDKARNQLSDDWVPNIILPAYVPLEPGKSFNRPPPITF